MFALEGLQEALETLGAVLASRGIDSRILVAGGSSLLLLGVVKRPTADLDVIGLGEDGRYVKAETIPRPLAEAVRDVGAALGLSEKWLNNGPASLFDFGLPEGFESRVTVRRYGSLEVHVVGRFDMICFKLYAAVDHSGQRTSKHLTDLEALDPSTGELLTAARWTRTHDDSDGFRQELTKILGHLGVGVEDAEF
ncbi:MULTISPECIES: hypothetical protein [unclassified Kribbella]|uniref:hypothetical protein n=1 Tax=unclassified Kribbella TaxID=2644121 RepID=UPI003018DB29